MPRVRHPALSSTQQYVQCAPCIVPTKLACNAVATTSAVVTRYVRHYTVLAATGEYRAVVREVNVRVCEGHTPPKYLNISENSSNLASLF